MPQLDQYRMYQYLSKEIKKHKVHALEQWQTVKRGWPTQETKIKNLEHSSQPDCNKNEFEVNMTDGTSTNTNFIFYFRYLKMYDTGVNFLLWKSQFTFQQSPLSPPPSPELWLSAVEKQQYSSGNANIKTEPHTSRCVFPMSRQKEEWLTFA